MRARTVGVVAASSILLLPGVALADVDDVRPSGEGAQATSSASGAKVAALETPTGAITLTATRAEVGSKAAADVINCRGGYDTPHAASSTAKRTVNAHLKITCTGGGAWLTLVTVTSRMVDGHRVGAPSSTTRLRVARTGGDLRCIKKKRGYQAKGRVHIDFPEGYEPPTATARARSVVRAFKRALSGKCVRP